MRLPLIIALLIIVGFFSSCSAKKDIIYFNKSTQTEIETPQWESAKIKPNDVVSLKITSDNPEFALGYNITSGVQNNVQGIQLLLQGYLVAEDGTVNIPGLGKQTIAGLTLVEVENKIQETLKTGGLLNNPVVICRVLNARYTVLGEVKSPGDFTFYENNLTLLQAIGRAGDLTINGIRKKVRIIRTENGKQIHKEIDLTKDDWLSSPFYYVKSNDVIIVDPNYAKVKSSGVISNPGTLLSTVSIIISTIILLRR